MIDRGTDVAANHADEIEDDGRAGPTVVGAEAPDKEDCTHNNTEKDAEGMTPRVERIFAFRIVYHGAKVRKSLMF